MISNIVSVIILLVLVGLFGWLTWRAWHSKRRVLKWIGVVLSGTLTLLFTVVTVIALVGFYRMNLPPHRYSISDVKVAMTPEQIARGQSLAYICTDCHSSTGSLPLDGSKDNYVAGGPPVGVIYASNLTPGGPLKDWTDGEIMRAIREGVDKNGRPLMIMPSVALHNLSDMDAQALVAFLRSQPVVTRDLPHRNLNAVAAIFVGVGMFPTSAQTPITQAVIAPAPGTPAYGKYLVSSLGCHDCHGQNLTGSSGGLGPSAPNIAAIVPYWSEADFLNLFRRGLDPSGREIPPKSMPWKSYGAAFTDSELSDIYTYIHSLPAGVTPTQ
jgi:mono/diheme cytochrome c family protein